MTLDRGRRCIVGYHRMHVIIVGSRDALNSFVGRMGMIILGSSGELNSIVRRVGMLHLSMGGHRGAVICWVTRFTQGDSLNRVWCSRGPVKSSRSSSSSSSRSSGKTCDLRGSGITQNVITHGICSRVSM